MKYFSCQYGNEKFCRHFICAERAIMKVVIDISLYTKEEGAFGNISGEINTPVPPQIGDSISFIFPENNLIFDPSIGFSGVLKVTDRVIAAGRADQPLMLQLSDITLTTKDDALKLAQHFESVFELFFVIYSK